MSLRSKNIRPLAISQGRSAFTLVELLVVMGIIIVLVGLTMPAIKSLSKSNDQSQATNLVRSMISTARSVAISQHRKAGIVFFEESIRFSSPVNSGQTAMQVFMEDYDQTGMPSGQTRYTYYSRERQYLPVGVRVASLSDNGSGNGNVEAGFSNSPARAILFDATGQLLLADGLSTAYDETVAVGVYPKAFGDWNFVGSPGKAPGVAPTQAYSSPGFFLYDKNEYDALPQVAATRATWIKNNATVVIVNSNTGGVIR